MGESLNNRGQVQHIFVLPPEEAMRIAAGEVVDRPAALVREFLDNAIDANAANIEVSIEEGGSKKTEVSDDGEGMSYDDLKMCTLTHATSKIRKLDDLETSRSLGFRGEALAAAAAVSRLVIISSTDGRNAYSLETGANHPLSIEQTRRTKGTTIRALNLFENIPARKQFLKREGAEGTLCRQTFIDKALAFPKINFRFIQDGKLKDFFPAASSFKERFTAAVLQSNDANFLHEINVAGSGFTAVIVIGGPEIYRNDRRQIYIFTNGRRINDYSLIQAVEYGSQGWFPNGTHPIAAIFIEIDPALADFNIHPAKREVRFRDSGAIHQAVSGGLKNFYHHYFLKLSNADAENEKTFVSNSKPYDRHGSQTKNETRYETFTVNRNSLFDRRQSVERQSLEKKPLNQQRPSIYKIENFIDTLRNKNENSGIAHNNDDSNNINISDNANPSAQDTDNSRPSDNNIFVNDSSAYYGEARYAGNIFGLFILIEWGDRLYIIDQHAAHERILYNKFLSEPVPKQKLLVPIPFTTESDDEDLFLEEKKEELKRLGVILEKDEADTNRLQSAGWRIEALPSDWHLDDPSTVKEILRLRTAGENMAERWAATLCCHTAIKDGDHLDDEAALALGMEALALPEPRCPHGRPIWTEISRNALFRAVRRRE